VSFDPKTFLANVGEGKAIAKYRKGSVVFSQGEAADAVFYIQKGQVKLTVTSEQGKEAVIAILGPGHFFGEGCLNGHALRIIGTTRARVSFFMNKFRKLGFIEYNGKLEVHNSLLNVVLYDKSEVEPDPANEPKR
jgi:CRP-like cAMP-binding protein